MKDSLNALCGRFVTNRDMLKKHFRMESTYIVPVCAAMLASKGICPDLETLRSCRNVLKKNTGVFSYLRGNVTLPVITNLASDDAPEEKIAKINEIYETLKKHLSGSEYLAYSASVLADMPEAVDIDAIAQRGKTIYKLMRKEHPMLTSAEDSTFAVLLALSVQSDKALIDDIELCYSTLKPVFTYGDHVQSISHVIALAGGDVRANCQKTIELYFTLKEMGIKYGKSYELSVLAALAVLPVDVRTLSADIAEADNFLSAQKGYGFWGLPKKTRLMHAAMLVSGDYTAGLASSTAAVSATIAMIAAQQAATAAAIAATTIVV